VGAVGWGCVGGRERERERERREIFYSTFSSSHSWKEKNPYLTQVFQMPLSKNKFKSEGRE
jgi:hypothetical protein